MEKTFEPIKMVKDGAAKIVDLQIVKELLEAEGWKEDKPEAKKKKAK